MVESFLERFNELKEMNICFLADAQSIHTKKWVRFFSMRGHQIDVISFSEDEIEGAHVHSICSRIPKSKLKYILNIRRVQKLIHKIHPDILHAHHVTSYGFLGACSHYHPFVITAHGSDILISPEKSFFFKMIVRYSFNKADLITTVAEHMKDRIDGLGIDRNRIHVFQYGIDLSELNMLKKKENEDERLHYVISTRALRSLYNIEIILRAFPLVLTVHPHVRLKIVGDGPLRQKLMSLAHQLGLQSKVAFKGMLSHPEVIRELYDSSVYISMAPSDGCSLSLLEALATGTIPVVSDIPANREWITDGENGFLVPLHDTQSLAGKIIQALDTQERLPEIQKRNWRLIEGKASIQKNLSEMDRLYRGLVNSSNENVSIAN